MFSLAVWKAVCISLAASVNAFSSSTLVLANACRISSEVVEALAPGVLMVLVPHLGQKSASFGSFSPQFEQYAINLPRIKQGRTANLSITEKSDGVFCLSKSKEKRRD